MFLLYFMKTVTKARLEKYFTLTAEAMKKAKLVKGLSVKDKKTAENFKDFCERYYNDAKYFEKKGDYVTAFAALNYAHAWLDAGAIQGFFDVKGENRLFTVD